MTSEQTKGSEDMVLHDTCLRCGRTLKNPVARVKGMGAVCVKKALKEQLAKLQEEAAKAVGERAS